MAYVEGQAGTDSDETVGQPGVAARFVSSSGLVALYSGTLLLAALLLFSLQPMFTKRVLPLLGGTPAVWSVAMVVFQTLLLAGYAYAHALTRWCPTRVAVGIHGFVLLGGFATLPVSVAVGFGAPPAETEAFWLIGLFLASIGLPFFALSASAPLLQAWFSRSGDPRAEDPYFLYRASNAGSFAALVAYPLLIEPLLGLDAQARLWSVGYGALTCAVMACAATIRSAAIRPGAQPILPASEAMPQPLGRGLQRLAWIGLCTVPSGLLVAATAHISVDVASIPLLWVIPLALYLLSFILAFRPGHAWPERPLVILQVGGSALALVWCAIGSAPLPLDLVVTLSLLTVNALIAHRAAYALRPPSERLTEFYLCTSLGGVIGGAFAALVAPRIFSGIYEYPILLAAALACRPGVFVGGMRALAVEGRRVLTVLVCLAAGGALCAFVFDLSIWILALVACLMLAFGLSWRVPSRTALFGSAAALACIVLPTPAARDGVSIRSFFGLHRVLTSADGHFRLLAHGTTLHGAIRLTEADGSPVTGRPVPTTYYADASAMAEVLDIARRAGGPLPAVSVVGLGTGSLACQARPGEAWTYYEIDPAIIRLATDPAQFRFLSECAPDARIVQGDARLTLAKRPRDARVLVVDAFSSDAIPMHLLTSEAIGIDLAHLDARGVLALHISNRHFELRHVLARLAAERGLTLLHRAEVPDETFAPRMRSASHVALMTRDPAVEREALARGWVVVPADLSRRPWSDDYANAAEALIDRWRQPLAVPPSLRAER